ncbi:MAG: transposase [Bacteroidia bacterium]
MAQGVKRDRVLAICGVSKNQYYYKAKGGSRGRKRSKITMRESAGTNEAVSNKDVTAYIGSKYEDPQIDYGYHKMTAELQLDGFKINHKKVYRLMKAGKLLRPKQDRESKQWVKYRMFTPEGPFRVFEMDIKQVWVKTESRYVYILTILDVFTRIVLAQTDGYSMTQVQVQHAWKMVIEEYLEPLGIQARDIHIEIRSDNGPQFCAKKLHGFFAENGFIRTFTHPYTPQENGHVESYHAILVAAMRGTEFENRQQLVEWRETFLAFYNYRRVHSSVAKLPPMTFLDQWEKGNIQLIPHLKIKRKARLILTIPRHTVNRVSQQAMRA